MFWVCFVISDCSRFIFSWIKRREPSRRLSRQISAECPLLISSHLHFLLHFIFQLEVLCLFCECVLFSDLFFLRRQRYRIWKKTLQSCVLINNAFSLSKKRTSWCFLVEINRIRNLNLEVCLGKNKIATKRFRNFF